MQNFHQPEIDCKYSAKSSFITLIFFFSLTPKLRMEVGCLGTQGRWSSQPLNQITRTPKAWRTRNPTTSPPALLKDLQAHPEGSDGGLSSLSHGIIFPPCFSPRFSWRPVALFMQHSLKTGELQMLNLSAVHLFFPKQMFFRSSAYLRCNTLTPHVICFFLPQDFLRGRLLALYASITVGNSPCHKFTHVDGHSGGFYHVVCPHSVSGTLKFYLCLLFFMSLFIIVLSLHWIREVFV